MRTLIFILLLTPILSFAQKTDVFIKLTDSKGQQLKGDALLRGYERWIVATTLNSSGKNNTQFTFTMGISGIAADLKRAMTTGEVLASGQINVLAPVQSPGAPIIAYTVILENIVVITCSEGMSADNVINTTVTLQAKRIGWTYYPIGKTATSGKFGWDSDTKSEWTNF